MLTPGWTQLEDGGRPPSWKFHDIWNGNPINFVFDSRCSERTISPTGWFMSACCGGIFAI